jgi:hypothetical protein
MNVMCGYKKGTNISREVVMTDFYENGNKRPDFIKV